MALIIEVKVVPSSGRNQWALDKSGILKCFLKSAPENGDANRELIKTLAKILGVIQNDVEIIVGLTSRKKTIKIHTDLTKKDFLQKIGVEEQSSLF